MILLSFIPFFVIKKTDEKNDQYLKSPSSLTYSFIYQNVNFNRKNDSNYSSLLMSNLNDSRSQSDNNFLSEKAQKNRLTRRNLWQKFVNKYLQETIFLSTSNPKSNLYSNKLKASGISVYQGSQYKNFLYKFSKDLINDNVKVLSKNLNNISLFPQNYDGVTSIKYKWLKFFSLGSGFFEKNGYQISDLSTKTSTKFINETLPFFVIINNNNEIVISESRDQLSRMGTLSSIKNQVLKSNINSKKFYTGLIFINPIDAVEYSKYIQNQYAESTHSTKLKVVPANINLYCKLMFLKDQQIEFRLIPDLKEVSSLVKRYKKYNNISFDKNQKYGNNFFQGQPVYFVKPFYGRLMNDSKTKEFNYSYLFGNNNHMLNCKIGFLNYETAMDAWQRFSKNNNYLKIPQKPQIFVSNLELLTQDNKDLKNYKKILLLPSISTYTFIKDHIFTSAKNKPNLTYWIINKSLPLKTLCHRFLWSLTSRQPVSW